MIHGERERKGGRWGVRVKKEGERGERGRKRDR